LDALGCQQHIVEQIVEKKGNYAIAVKGSQPTLETAVHKVFDAPIDGVGVWRDRVPHIHEEISGARCLCIPL